jgi:hypothetical protein
MAWAKCKICLQNNPNKKGWKHDSSGRVPASKHKDLAPSKKISQVLSSQDTQPQPQVFAQFVTMQIHDRVGSSAGESSWLSRPQSSCRGTCWQPLGLYLCLSRYQHSLGTFDEGLGLGAERSYRRYVADSSLHLVDHTPEGVEATADIRRH